MYVGFNRDHKILVASSHDGGITFTSADAAPKLKLVRSLAGGATVDPQGSVYLAWAGYTRHDGAKGRENLYVSKSSNGGESWATRLMDVSGAPPDCGAFPLRVGIPRRPDYDDLRCCRDFVRAVEFRGVR